MVGARILMAAIALAVLAGCATQPMTRDRAARMCADEARLADGVAGRVGVGAGSSGGIATGQLTMTSDVLNPRSEAEALEECIARVMAGGDVRASSGPRFVISIGGSFETDP